MSQEIFPDKPSDNLDPSLQMPSTTELLNRQHLDQRLAFLTTEVERLRYRLGWITGVAVVALLIAGALMGLAINTKQQQDRQQQQVGTLSSNKADLETQISSLSQQLSALDQKVKVTDQQVTLLNQQLPQKVNQSQLKQLAVSIQQLNSNAVTKKQLNEVLQRVQPNVNDSSQFSTSSPSIAPSP